MIVFHKLKAHCSLLKAHCSLLIALILSSLLTFAQNDSCSLRISLLTCNPGEDLYAIFGHSALRVKDPSMNMDIIFNYGTFDFDDPDFYTKFMRGKLIYFLSVEGFSDFTYAYQLENRGIVEQVLNLPCTDRQQLFQALKQNSDEASKFYAYDFFFDNCSTRLRDIVARNSGGQVTFKNILPAERLSFRQEIHTYLDRSQQYWSKLGMDLLLGLHVDRKVTNEESMFLPDNLYKGFDSAIVYGRPLVGSRQVVNAPNLIKPQDPLMTPAVIFSLLLVMGLVLALTRKNRSMMPLRLFDAALFFLVGLMGAVMLLMWLGTEHKVCRDNLNVLWAWPTHLVMCFFIYRPSRIGKYYFGIHAIICVAVLVGWYWWPQQLHPALIPLLVLLAYRSLRISLKH